MIVVYIVIGVVGIALITAFSYIMISSFQKED